MSAASAGPAVPAAAWPGYDADREWVSGTYRRVGACLVAAAVLVIAAVVVILLLLV